MAAGTKVWTFNAIIDREISKDDLKCLPPHTVALIVRHAEYRRDRRMFLLSGDGDHFMNHSDDPNIVKEGGDMVACRDIQSGDELLCDYRVPRFWPLPDNRRSGDARVNEGRGN